MTMMNATMAEYEDIGQWGAIASIASSGASIFSKLFGGGGPTRAQKVSAAVQGGQNMYVQAMSSPQSLTSFIERACSGTNVNGVGYVPGRDGVFAAYKVAKELAAVFPGLPPLTECGDTNIVYGKGGDPCAPYPKWLNTFYQAVCARKSEIFSRINATAPMIQPSAPLAPMIQPSTPLAPMIQPPGSSQGLIVAPSGSGNLPSWMTVPTQDGQSATVPIQQAGISSGNLGLILAAGILIPLLLMGGKPQRRRSVRRYPKGTVITRRY